MKKLFFSIYVLAASLVFSAERPTALAPVAQLVGGMWLANLPVPKGSPGVQLEATFEWAENEQAIRFTSAWVREGKKSPYTSGFYAWNAAEKKIVIFYTDAEGSLTEGSATLDNGVLVHELSVADKSGTVTSVQTRLTFKASENSWTNEIFLKKDGAWSPFVAVTYSKENN